MVIDGIEVVDSKTDRVLHITQAHVDLALRNKGRKDGWNCAAQVSCFSQRGVEGAMVNKAVSYVLTGRGTKQRYQRYWTSGPLRTEIISFDRSGIFTPGDYALLKVPKSKASRGKAHSPPTLKHGRPGHHRRPPISPEGARAHAMCGLRAHGHDTIHGRPQKKK